MRPLSTILAIAAHTTHFTNQGKTILHVRPLSTNKVSCFYHTLHKPGQNNTSRETTVDNYSNSCPYHTLHKPGQNNTSRETTSSKSCFYHTLQKPRCNTTLHTSASATHFTNQGVTHFHTSSPPAKGSVACSSPPAAATAVAAAAAAAAAAPAAASSGVGSCCGLCEA